MRPPAGSPATGGQTTADAYLEILARRGIKYFFGNAGTDFAPLLEAFTKRAMGGKSWPEPVLCPHEATAVSMAHGYTMLTGEPQAVMVHVTVGTANAACQLMNASRSQIPMLFTAGRTPITEEGVHGGRNLNLHWAQEAFDQAAMVREYVKWDYELRNRLQLEDVLDRALAMATSDPAGPVYLTLPREVLAEESEGFALRRERVRHRGASSHPNPREVERAAGFLAAAERPLVIVGNLGRDPEAVASLVQFAETGGVPVVEFHALYMNFPSEHQLHLGFNPDGLVQEADAVLVIECPTPWFPGIAKPPASARVIHLGRDPYFSRYVMRSYPGDAILAGDPAAGLRSLQAALADRLDAKGETVKRRRERCARTHQQQRAAWAEEVARVREARPIDPRWLSACINHLLDDETILLNEYVLDLRPIALRFPGTYFRSSHAGGLGWALGASLGAKLARPEKTVLAVVGDGTYIYNAPTSAHFVSRAQGLPCLTIILNNRMWSAVRTAVRHLYPDGICSSRDEYPLSRLEPAPDYEKIVEASGGYGERVEDPSGLLPALRRGIRAVRNEGRQVVLNVICGAP